MLNNAGFVLALIIFCINLLTCLISLVILIFVIHQIFYNRLKQDDKVVINLCAHIYFLIFFFTAIMVSLNIHTILGDLYGKNFNSSWCVLLGYLGPVVFGTLYWIFVNQVIINLNIIFYFISFLGFLSSLLYCIFNL